MAKWAPAKTDTLDALAREIVHNYPGGRVIVAVDGAAGIGTGPFADDLAAALRATGREVARASIETFRRGRGAGPQKADDQGSDGQAADDRGAHNGADWDSDAVRRDLVVPFRTGTAGPAAAMLVVDGVFLHRPALSGVWNYSVWLEGTSPGAIPDVDAAEAERYAAESSPRTAASAIVDNGDPEHPRRVFADSC